MPHYTADMNTFTESITADFIGQIARRLEDADMSQKELAEKAGVPESEVSQILNLNRINLGVKTMAKYARALGMKLAIVAYDDGDPQNENGPIGSEIFTLAWDKCGKPHNVWTFSQPINSVQIKWESAFNKWWLETAFRANKPATTDELLPYIKVALIAKQGEEYSGRDKTIFVQSY